MSTTINHHTFPECFNQEDGDFEPLTRDGVGIKWNDVDGERSVHVFIGKHDDIMLIFGRKDHRTPLRLTDNAAIALREILNKIYTKTA